MVFASAPEYALACLVLCAASAVYLIFGFGAGLIAVGLLALLLPDLRDVVVLLLLINVPMELFVVLRSRRLIAWRGVARLCAGVVVGIPLGTVLLRFGEPTIVLAMLGGFLLLTGVVFLFLPERESLRWPGWAAFPVGLTSGWLAGTFGTGGPPLVLFYRLDGTRKAAFRGNLMAIFLVTSLIKLPSYLGAGLITLPRVWSAIAVLPAVGLGAWIGHRIHLDLAEATFRRAVSLFLALVGGLLLYRAV